jgi:hypothetical protein
MFPQDDFPRLTNQNHRVTSPASADYNCVAWSAGDIEHWWQPGLHWPIAKLGRSEDIEHDHPDDVAGGLYGEIVQFMKRRAL